MVSAPAEVIERESRLKRETAELLLERRKSSLVRGVRPFAGTLDLSAVEEGTLPPNFSAHALGDYVCNVLNTTIVRSGHGRLDNILLTIPPNLGQDGGIVTDPAVDRLDARHFQSILSYLDDHTHVTLLCHVHQVSTVESWLGAAGIPASRANICLSVFKYSIWTQDAYVALSDVGGDILLCEGVNFPRYDDMSIADVAAQSPLKAIQSYLYFQGGDVLGTSDRTLVGADYVMKNFGRAHLETIPKVKEGFEKLFGRDMISLGRSSPIPEATGSTSGAGSINPSFTSTCT